VSHLVGTALAGFVGTVGGPATAPVRELFSGENPGQWDTALWLASGVNADARLERLTLDHARPLEQFERANRAFFAARVGDRGDDYFEHFDDQLAARVVENQEGTSLFFVVVDTNGEVLARVNISDIDQPTLTELGYRVAEHAQGRGIATQGVITALDIAATRGVKTVRARVPVANLASRRVLEHCGFDQTGQTKAPNGSSETFIGYRKDLVRASCSPNTEPS
jgi:ribosomal-protein-alanine N-acetyltransferase